MSRTSSPFFTIITATYNAAGVLSRLLASLESQTCQDFVWVCQDGASSDDTLVIAKQWEGKIVMSIASEKDTGIYDAWNKAIARQGDELGEWVLFLGADDMLVAPDVLEKAKQILMKTSSDIIFGVGEKQDILPDGSECETTNTNINEQFEMRMLGTPLPHTALFSRSNLFKNELFDTSFIISADYDWILRLWKNPSQAVNLNILITKMALGGISTTEESVNKIFFEKIKICLRHFGNRRWNYCFVLTLHFIEKKLAKPKKNLMHICKKNKILTLVWNGLHLLRKKFLAINK